ncbi:acyl-CoA N-acyltransferase [Hyaloscypha finlandica]|nr:acyl-CoA N-acyltransferase [Hyaloscypha finlandica]KAH8791293.1 acyl-CoA N-acyltransferase [Hyaloscypha sp. PMI_1271]
MPLTLSLATPADLPNLVRAQYAAFHPNDTLHVLIYPSPDRVPESTFEKTVERQTDAWKDNVTWVKVTDDETGSVIAGAKWIFWPKSGGWAEEKGKRWPESFGIAYVSWIMEEFMGRRRERNQGPAALLDICYVHPDWQGRGAGKLLVQWGTEKADELGLRTFVEASYFGRPLYEKFGFVVGEHVLLEGGNVKEEWREYGQIGYYWMERQEREAKALED